MTVFFYITQKQGCESVVDPEVCGGGGGEKGEQSKGEPFLA